MHRHFDVPAVFPRGKIFRKAHIEDLRSFQRVHVIGPAAVIRRFFHIRRDEMIAICRGIETVEENGKPRFLFHAEGIRKLEEPSAVFYRGRLAHADKAAADYGTYIEINAKKTHLRDEELADIAAKTSARFVIGSDAHSPARVGEISLAEELIARTGLDERRIDNIDGRLPQFRFRAYKEKHG